MLWKGMEGKMWGTKKNGASEMKSEMDWEQILGFCAIK